MKTLTRASLSEGAANYLGMPKVQANQILTEMLFEIISELDQNQSVKISSFGCFQTRKKTSRTGRNPKTGESAHISARRVVSFRASPVLKRTMNRSNNNTSSRSPSHSSHPATAHTLSL